MRPEPGPRDWHAPSSAGGNFPPSAPSVTYAAPVSPRRDVHPLRGIGVLALLLGAGSLIIALGSLTNTNADPRGILLLPAGAIVAAVVGIAVRGIGRGARTAAWCGLTLTVAAGVVFAAAALHPVAATPVSLHPVSAPVAPVATSIPSTKASLVQSAGTLVYLVRKSGVSCPDVLAPSSTGMFVLPGGNLQLSTGAVFEYSGPHEGTCSLAISAPDVGRAVWDSVSGVVTFEG